MSGHSKWSNIKRTKGKTDAERAKVFTKIGREITVAAKTGTDPNSNSKLRDVINKARKNNMPNDSIQRAIKRASETNLNNYEEVTYEGYGIKGVALLVTALTDNRNRTAADVRHLFDKFNGSLGTAGSVTYMFDYRGVIVVNRTDKTNEDNVMMTALDAGAEDVISEDDCFEVVTKPEMLHAVNKAFEDNQFEVLSSEVAYVPQNMVELEKDAAISINKLILSLEDLDDVQNVYSNADLSALDE